MSHSSITALTTFYQNRTALEAFIQASCPSGNWMVCIHTCIHNSTESVEIAKQVAELLPGAVVLGTSASAVICGGGIYTDRCLLSFTRFQDTRIIKQRGILTEHSPESLAAEIRRTRKQNHAKSFLAFFSGFGEKMQECFDLLSEQDVFIPIGGGLVSANPHGAFVFDETGAQENAWLLAAFSGETFRTWHCVVSGHETFGAEYTVTEAKGCELLSIEQKPASLWLHDKLKISASHTKEQNYNDILAHFPLVITDNSQRIRFLRYSQAQDTVQIRHIPLPTGNRFQIGYFRPLTAAAEWKQVFHDLSITPCETLFTYVSVYRQIYFKRCLEWEQGLFQNCPVCGAFLAAEIAAIHQKNALYTGTNSLFGFTESNQSYLPLDKTQLEVLHCLEEDWKDICQYIQKIEQDASQKQSPKSYETPQFAEQILEQDQSLRRTMFIDKETGLENLVKFKYDASQNQYNKICMISIEQGLLISGRRGERVWNDLLQEDIRQVKSLLQDESLHLYCNDKWSFFFTASSDYPDTLFLQKAEEAFQECGYCFCAKHNLTAVNKFHVVIGETDLLEKVQLCMSSSADHNTRFFLYNADNADLMRQMDEKLFMTNIISDAILYDRIVPYFQPIRDNRTKQIQKYEALMRLSDKDQNIYAPGQFLEIAKDYRLYLQLSHLMIRKVLKLFQNRTETVFLNLSAYDIDSPSNRSFLYDLIKELPMETCSRITFEILESEKIQNIDETVDFLKGIRKFGIKIALDDFGAGYSNLTAIVRVRPDFIKIDGDLIMGCDKDPVKQLCLQAITDIARGIDAELIAEHVENSEEQETIESVNIDYTQGYYFSKPLPYSSLESNTASAVN